MVTVTVALGSLSPKASNQSIQHYHHQVKENISEFDLEDIPLHKKYLSIMKRTEKKEGEAEIVVYDKTDLVMSSWFACLNEEREGG